MISTTALVLLGVLDPAHYAMSLVLDRRGLPKRPPIRHLPRHD